MLSKTAQKVTKYMRIRIKEPIGTLNKITSEKRGENTTEGKKQKEK